MRKKEIFLIALLITALLILFAPKEPALAAGKKVYKVFPSGAVVLVKEPTTTNGSAKSLVSESTSLDTLPKAVVKPGLEYDTLITEASITKYVATGNNMANREKPYVGAVACSDYKLAKPPWKAKVKIDGQWYDVKDRTAKWIHKKRGLTFDIFSTETRKQCLKFGRKKKVEVVILIPKK